MKPILFRYQIPGIGALESRNTKLVSSGAAAPTTGGTSGFRRASAPGQRGPMIFTGCTVVSTAVAASELRCHIGRTAGTRPQSKFRLARPGMRRHGGRPARERRQLLQLWPVRRKTSNRILALTPTEKETEY